MWMDGCADGWIGAYENGALWADGEAARMGKHGLLAVAIPAAARSRAGEHRKHALLEHANAMMSSVGDVRAAVGADREAARVEERGGMQMHRLR